jgi:hypothetical protein
MSDDANASTDSDVGSDSESDERREALPPEELNRTIREKPAFALSWLGAAVVLDPFFTANVPTLEAQFQRALDSMPEYRRDKPADANYVLGAFSALGNASAWHNEFVRFIRLHAMRAVYPLYLAELADRMLNRLPDVATPADSMHRDIKPNQRRHETVYGGWINTSAHTQYLSCVLGTHRDEPVAGDEEGFAKITDPALVRVYRREMTRVEVPPGGILVFNERMVHEVLRMAVPYTVRRVFLAFMTTPVHGEHYPADIRTLLRTQAVIPLKSGQQPTLYPNAYFQYFITELVRWSNATFVPQMLRTKTQPPTAKQLAGQTVQIAPQKAPSLEAAGLPLYAPYAAHEINLFFAASEHVLPREVGGEELDTLRLN